jgi:hypothetical protein
LARPDKKTGLLQVKYDGDSYFPAMSGYEKEDSTNGEDPGFPR